MLEAGPGADYYIQTGPVPFGSTYERVVGGTTWHWLGSMIRLLPSDFEMKTRPGVGVDWPIAYRDLEPWYLEGEKQLGTAGDANFDLGSPRSAPYPLPPSRQRRARDGRPLQTARSLGSERHGPALRHRRQRH